MDCLYKMLTMCYLTTWHSLTGWHGQTEFVGVTTLPVNLNIHQLWTL